MSQRRALFPPTIYRDRRRRLAKDVGAGLILFLGNEEVGMNYTANVYPFRQDSSFLYQWKAEGRHAAFINWTEVEKFRDARGCRIEDDVLVTATGGRVLGPGIPKTIAEVEEACTARE